MLSSYLCYSNSFAVQLSSKFFHLFHESSVHKLAELLMSSSPTLELLGDTCERDLKQFCRLLLVSDVPQETELLFGGKTHCSNRDSGHHSEAE